MMLVFSPGATYTASVTTSSTYVDLPGYHNSCRITNNGSVTIYFRIGIGATAVTTDNALAPGQSEVFGIPPNGTGIAMITASGTAAVSIGTGEGA